MSTLAKDFNVGSVQGGHYQRMDVTLTWDSEVPMEFRLHMWQPTAKRFAFGEDGWATGKSEGITVIWSISRDLLVEATAEIADKPHGTAFFGSGDVEVSRHWVTAAGMDHIRLYLASDNGAINLAFKTKAVAEFVSTSLHKCPTESESLDVDGLITEIFHHAEEAES